MLAVVLALALAKELSMLLPIFDALYVMLDGAANAPPADPDASVLDVG
jgi:hypothetical protein